MAILKNKKEREYYRKFHIPSCSNLMSVKLNAIFLHRNEKKGYTLLHERMKFELAWEAKGNGDNYIIEAARSATDEERRLFDLKKDKIVDFVNISQQTEYEIVHLNENDLQIKYYRNKGIIPILVGETIICKSCGEKYPKRNNLGICQLCRTPKVKNANKQHE